MFSVACVLFSSTRRKPQETIIAFRVGQIRILWWVHHLPFDWTDLPFFLLCLYRNSAIYFMGLFLLNEVMYIS